MGLSEQEKGLREKQAAGQEEHMEGKSGIHLHSIDLILL